MSGHGFPYDDDELGGDAEFERDRELSEADEREREQDRDAEKAPPAKRAVWVEVPAGEGSPQVEFYRELMGLPCTHEIRIEATS